ncbi:GtrA family protein [Paenarthrobacter ilicis]|uniref:Flippase GtrA n=1 Tax=Paenarthrobacter ilicis TaxID=43665 RepID=A0ABX0TBF3_9MICC|nr:GtrA family protein [Paenarthrobacter ilicis]MBM7793613.1 putative flippase GtrA [Paenarthrobacter ilicis]NII99793.1 putative flippase GtrA [Paenarthrobacter ilicis]
METAADDTGLRPPTVSVPHRKRHRGVLRYPVVRQLVRFTGVGIVCTASSLGIYALLRPWIDPQLANAVALILTSLMNTALNRRLTFKITGRTKRAKDHLSGVLVIGIALLITGGSLGILHLIRPEATVSEELWTTTLSGFVATAVRFALLRHWIFRRARHV